MDARQLTGILAIVVIVGGLIGIMMFMSRQEEKLRAGAQKLVDEAAQGKSLPTHSNEIVFRKPQLFGYVFLAMFALLILCVPYFSAHALTRVQFAEIVLLSILPLTVAIRTFRYRVRVSGKDLTITDIKTRGVPLQDISDVSIGTSRASSFCRIRLTTGEEDIGVASDLKDFPEFVKLLCDRVDAAKEGR